MGEVGFEPTHPKITDLKSVALDHSAIRPAVTAMDYVYFKISQKMLTWIGTEFKVQAGIGTLPQMHTHRLY